MATIILRTRELKPSIVFDNTSAAHRAADIWFGALASRRYLLLVHSEEPGMYTLLDPAGEEVLQQDGLAGVVTPARLLPPLVDGRYAIKMDDPTTIDYVVDQVPYQALLLELEVESMSDGAYLLGDLQADEQVEFNFNELGQEGIIIYAAPTGPVAGELSFSLELYDSAGDFQYAARLLEAPGEPVSIVWLLPPDGQVTVRLSETNGMPGAYELLVLPLERDFVELFAPLSVEPMSGGDIHSGELLYTFFKCHRCHGFLAIPGSDSGGPWLGNIGNEAGQRIAGLSAVEYLTYTIIDPDMHFSDACIGEPCVEITMEVNFGEDISRQELADLVAYLQSLKEE